MDYQAKLKELQEQLEALTPITGTPILFNMSQTDNTGDFI